MKLASPEGFARDPALVWQWYQWRRELISQSTPNAGHRALAELATSFDKFYADYPERRRLSSTGRIERRARTPTATSPAPSAQPRAGPSIRNGSSATATRTHHLHRIRGKAWPAPDVVWFGEALDEKKQLKAAFAAAADCELMLVVGTAGAVHPAATLPSIARQSGAEIVEINPDETELSHLTRWRLRGPASFWLPKLQAGLIETA